MRLAAIASALAIVLCVAVVGAIFLQKASVQAPTPALATPTEGRAPAGPVVTAVDSPATSPARAAEAPAAVVQAAPMPPPAPSPFINPNALWIPSVVQIGPPGCPGFRFAP